MLQTKRTLVGILLAVMPYSALADSISPTTSLLMGHRWTTFRAAASDQSLNMTDVTATVGAAYTSKNLPMVVELGAFASHQSMIGNLGDALTEFSGYQIGPLVRASHRFGSWAPFAKLQYGVGTYKGTGSENWGERDDAAVFLFDAEQSSSARYVTRGTQLGIGGDYHVSKMLAVRAEFGYAQETLETNARIIDNDRVLSGKRRTSFPSRSLAFGANLLL